MKPSTYTAISTVRGSSAADITTVSTLVAPNDASAALITVETTSARVTFDGSNPGTGGTAPSHVFPKDVAPQLVLIGNPCTISWVSTAAAASVVQVTWWK